MDTKIIKSEILKNIFLLEFETQLELASTFLRLQEYYESPQFKGKIFTLNEYKDWYTKEKGKFSYYTDWGGFNIPSSIITSFTQGLFNPLSDKETNLINLFKEVPHPFYIIGIHKELESHHKDKYLKHETAHGLYYTNSKYREKVENILSQYDLVDFKNWLKSTGGYHEEVLDDECHAYAIAGSSKLDIKLPEEMIRALENIHKETLELYTQNPDFKKS